jgi:hypothetical protein
VQNLLENIKYRFSDKYKLSEVFYVQSGNSVAKENYDKRNAVGILYLGVYWLSSGGVDITLTVEKNVQLISIDGADTSFYKPIPLIREATYMQVTATGGGAVPFSFVVAHQYIHF